MPTMQAPLLALGLLCAGIGAASAQSCGEEIDRLAQQYAINTDGARTSETGLPATPPAPPATTESRGVTGTERLGSSSGVTSPPDVREPMAVPPPRSSEGSKAPQAAPPPSGTRRGGDLTPAERTQIETQLAAARTALREGRMGDCLDHLREAEAAVGVPGKRAPR
jgi:hypothetical protein